VPPAGAGATVRRAAATAAASVLLLAAVYFIAVRTGVGQRFENAVWLGAGQTAMQRPAQAVGALNLIGNWSGAAAVAVVFVIGLLRRQFVLAVAAVALIGASLGTTEVLKTALSRPNLVPGWGDSAGNSFPSGHTTIAMSVMFALVLVVPYRFRGLIAFCAAAPATEIGALTIVARWHRPSDTLGADLVVLCWASLIVLALAASGRVRPVEPHPPGLPSARGLLTVAPIALGTATALCGAVLFAALTYYHRVHFAPGYEISHYALYAGCLIALAGSGLATLVLLRLLARLDLTAPARKTVGGRNRR
jgi:membrane-associated phospholipid phosphatase